MPEKRSCHSCKHALYCGKRKEAWYDKPPANFDAKGREQFRKDQALVMQNIAERCEEFERGGPEDLPATAKRLPVHFEMSGVKQPDGSVRLDGVSICPGEDPARPVYGIGPLTDGQVATEAGKGQGIRHAAITVPVQAVVEHPTWRHAVKPFSERGHELFWSDSIGAPEKPTITVEQYMKWYTLYLVLPDGEIRPVNYPDLSNYDKLGSPYHDHDPNPRHVYAWAMFHGYHVDSEAGIAMAREWDFYRMEAKGIEMYEVHPEDTLGEDWRKVVAEALGEAP